MAIYRTGTCSMTAGGVITGVGTKWKTPLSLIRVGATIVFLQNPIRMATISAIVSDTELRAIETDGAAVPSGNYILMLHDSITVDGLAQDVSETLRYYQSQETQLSDALEYLQSIDYDALKVQLQAAIDAAAAAAASADAANTSKNAAAASATSATASATSATASKNAAKTSENNAAASAAAASTTLASAYKDFTLTSTTDLNTLNSYDKFGIYQNVANANATPANNYPEAKAGTLLVTKSAYGCQQMYITFDNNCIYVRGIMDTTLAFRPWKMAGFSTSSTFYSGDMNALSTVGRWTVTTAATNLPISQIGICTVETRTTEIIQTYRTVATTQYNADRVFYRTGNAAGTTWSKWSEVITDSKSLPSDISNVYPTAFISALTSDPAGAHKPVLSEEFGGVSVARGLRPAQFGVSGRGASASFWFRGYDNATSVASDWISLVKSSALGNSASMNVGTTSGTVAAGNDARLNTIDGKSGGAVKDSIKINGSNSASSTQGYLGFANANGDLYSAIYSERAGDLTFATNLQGVAKYLQFLKSGDLLISASAVTAAGRVFSFTGAQSTYLECVVDGGVKGINFFDSDATLKEKVKNADEENAIDIIRKVRPVSYKFKDYQYEVTEKDPESGEDVKVSKTQEGGEHKFGVIAQEFEKLLPEGVITHGDGKKALDPLEILGLLITTCHAQQKMIDELKEDVKKLNGE